MEKLKVYNTGGEVEQRQRHRPSHTHTNTAQGSSVQSVIRLALTAGELQLNPNGIISI